MFTNPFASALIEISPWSRSGEAREVIRIADGPTPGTYGLGDVRWDAAVKARPTISMDVSSPRLDGGLRAGRASFVIAIGNLRSCNYKDLFFRSAPVRIYATSSENFSTATTEFQGRIVNARESSDGSALTVDCQVWTSDIERPLLVNEFSGFGGIEGDISLRGTLRPAGFGINENIPPVWFDLTDNIGQIDGYANTLAITRLMEGASDFGPAFADYPTYAQLKAAIAGGTVKEGRWATCIADGLIGLGAPPVGLITINAQFGSNRVGQICRRILTAHAGISPTFVDEAAFNAVDAAVNRPVHYWTKTQRTVQDLFEKLARSANCTPLVTLQGMVSITRAVASAPIGTIDCSGALAPRVKKREYAALTAPYWQIKARASRPASVLTFDQVNYADNLVDRGLYGSAIIYRQGNIVWLKDGSQWLYINDTPSAGYPPPVGSVSNDYWQNMQRPTRASDIAYDSGELVEALKPAQAGADKTALNTSANTAQVGTKLSAALVAELGVALDTALEGEYFIVRMESTDPATGTSKATLVVNADGIVVSQSMIAGPDGGVIGWMADEFYWYDSNGGTPRQAGKIVNGRWTMWDVYIDKLEIGSVLTGSIALNAVVDGDTVALASPLAGNGAWRTAVTYTLEVPAPVSDEIVDWQVVAIVTGSQSFPSGDRTWDTRLMFDGTQEAHGGGEKTSDIVAMSGRVNWGTGVHTILVEHKAQTTVTLAELNMTILWFKR